MDGLVKPLRWWSPDSPGTLLSRQWVQTLVFELPDLNQAELQTSLWYKVQATLPVRADQFILHTQVFHREKTKYGVAFLVPKVAAESFPPKTRDLRVAVPLTVPKEWGHQVLLFVLTPEGLSPNLYDRGILTTSFALVDVADRSLRQKLVEKFPQASVYGWEPIPQGLLSSDFRQPTEAQSRQSLASLLFWDPRPPSPWPGIVGSVFLVAGLALLMVTLGNAWELRVQRNEAWRGWLLQNEAESVATTGKQTWSAWLEASGVPVPDLFDHLSTAWGPGTKILDLEWTQGKLTLTAESSSALASLKKLTADPWFKNLKVADIRTQKDGKEAFSVEGELSFDP